MISECNHAFLSPAFAKKSGGGGGGGGGIVFGFHGAWVVVRGFGFLVDTMPL